MPDLSVKLGPLHLKNPILVASGTFGFGREYGDYGPLAELGGIITNAITLKPRQGNPPPRLVETPAGILNAIGLENPGVDYFLEKELPFLQARGATVIVNIAGSTVEEYQQVAAKLSNAEIAAIEVNISCPNVREGGIAFGTEPAMATAVTEKVREVWPGPLIVKLSPNVGEIGAIAKAVVAAGADAVSLINTLTGLAIDPVTWEPKLGNITGGLSGPAIGPVALRMVWETAQKVSAPILGMGGIVTIDDVVSFLLAGASCVAIGTGNFQTPDLAWQLIGELEAYLLEYGLESPKELVGQIGEGR